VEAKCLADASGKVSYDPLRNQLARVIENVLCFQGDERLPDRLFFTLLTPRLFKDHPTARLYGYKMRDYEDPAKLLCDIETCSIPKRRDAGYAYPDLVPRLDALTLNWVCYEDLLEPECGTNLDIVRAPEGVAGLTARIAAALKVQPPQFVEFLETTESGQVVIGRAVLQSDEVVRFEGLAPSFRENMQQHGIIVGPNKQRRFPTDGLKFLEGLKVEFSGTYLRATDVQG
jgi:hypothetical protein